ncbi:RidA family protein [Microbacterium sp. LWH3-1.2]|uniref:RidA family protein n=1 Tax=Microbacterium sp. LWH3-1.2 TaxID=3135256 RepID=UPI00343D9702
MPATVPEPRRVGNADVIHHDGFDDSIVSPFVPAIRAVSNARLVFISGVTGAPVYHDHPHVPAVFDAMPMDAAGQVRNAFAHLDLALAASGCTRSDVVNMIRFFTDVEADQNVVNSYQSEWFEGHISTSTTVEVTRMATDPRLRFEFHVVAAAPGA